MKNREISRQIQALNTLFKKSAIVSGTGDLELHAHYGQYLCVRVAGFLENALEALYADYSAACSNPSVSRFVAKRLSRIQNPKAHRFGEIAGEFDATWREELLEYMAEEGRKDAIDSIMANRHLIAHGRASGITPAAAKQYYLKSIEVLEFVENQLS